MPEEDGAADAAQRHKSFPLEDLGAGTLYQRQIQDHGTDGEGKGYLYITGRLKNLIILSNGENVSPEEIENAMLTNDLVGEIIISGEENGLAARIYPDPDVVEAKGLSPEEVQAQLQAILDDYNKTQPLYRAITALTVRKYPFVKNATKKIVRAKMDVDEAPEEG